MSMHVTMRNGIPDLIRALQEQATMLPVQVAENAVQQTRELVPSGIWQKALQASVYVVSGQESDYQEAVRQYSQLVVSTLQGLVIQGLANLTYHQINELAVPLPPQDTNTIAVTSCADIDKLNSIGIESIGSTFWDDIAAQVEVEL